MAWSKTDKLSKEYEGLAASLSDGSIVTWKAGSGKVSSSILSDEAIPERHPLRRLSLA